MAGQRSIRAGQAYVELLAQDNDLRRGLERAQRMLTSFGTRVRNIGAVTAAAGAAMTAPFLAASKIFQSVGDDLAKMSARTGISVEALSELGYAAGQSGADLETLEKGVRTMQRTLIDAERGMSTATDALDGLGLSVGELLAKDPEGQFLAIAKALAGVEDPTRRAALAMQVFGRTGTQLLPLLSDGVAGIDALRAQARGLGLTLSTDAAKRAEVLGDRMDDLRLATRAVAVTVGDALAPALTSSAKRAAALVAIAGSWIKRNQSVVKVAFAAGLATTALGAGLLAVAAAAGGLGLILGGISTLIGAAGAAVAALLSPIGLTVAAVAGLGAVVLKYTKVGGVALEWLGERFTDLRKFAGETFEAMARAIESGSLESAVAVAGSAVLVKWAEAMQGINLAWSGTLREMLVAFEDFQAGVGAAMAHTRKAISDTDATARERVHKAAVAVGSGAEMAAAKAAAEAQKAWARLNLPDDEAGEAIARIDQALTAKLADIGAAAELANQSIDLAVGEQRENAAEQLGGDLLDVLETYDAAAASIDKRFADRISAATTRLEEARRKYDEAVAEAGEGGPTLGVAPTLQARIDAILDGLGRVRGVEAKGTFSAAAAQDLGFRDRTEERQLDETKQINKNTRDLLREFRQGGAYFA